MSKLMRSSHVLRRIVLTAALAAACFSAAPRARAVISFLGVAAGDATSTTVSLWTRAENGAPTTVVLSLDLTTDQNFISGIVHMANACTTDASRDSICKAAVSNLTPNTVYYYRFAAPSGETSNIGRFKTAPLPSVQLPVHFAFSGDYDGLMRPYALASQIPGQNLDFYMSLGDVIYETASAPPGHTSAATTLTGASSSLNGVPTCTGFATQAQLRTDYERKYRENFQPVNAGGQNSLQPLYAAQGNYTTWDNHELGNRQYINGGAPAGPGVGGMTTGCGVDARLNGTGNPNNVNDTNFSNPPPPAVPDYMNRSTGFQTLEDVLVEYNPIANRGTISAPNDPRTDTTRQLYMSQAWGRNVIFINTDTRSYRDLRLKTANGGADDTKFPRADNAQRTYLGATQLAWLKQTLLDAQNAGTKWKFVSVSDPIDQLGPIGDTLSLNLPAGIFGAGSTYAPVASDGGKSWMGGYRAERNNLLAFIVDNHITNVVFIATDDHQNRVNELTYSPTGDTATQGAYVRVPYAFSIVAGPLGATGPDAILAHTFDMAKQYADGIVAAQMAAGIEPLGLMGNLGLHDVVRDGDPTAGTSPQAVDFYSPDTFNFNVLDVSGDGGILSVKSIGMAATATNTATEIASAPPVKTLFSFQMDAAPTVTNVQINDGSAQRSRVKSVTVTLSSLIAQNSILPGAFSLVDTEGDVFGVSVKSFSVVRRQPIITLGFTGPGVGPDGSLPDGSYSLKVNRNKIPIDSPAPIVEIARFKTLFGDLNGDGRVDGSEVSAAAHAINAKLGDPDYLWYLDFNADGQINGQDHREVAKRNGGK